MSDREFDTYLTLLASLLKLDRRQRGKIAEELRSHLEDRLDDLLAEGVPRDEAIGQALAEFGDAAGLAAEFRSLARDRKRRWLMRVTTFSVAATLLIAAGIVTFWPGRNAGPGIAQVGAQDEAKSQEQDPFARPKNKRGPAADPFGAPEAEADAKAAKSRPLEEILEQRTDVEFVETPLSDVFAFLSVRHDDIAILPKRKELDEAGIALDHPVTFVLKGVRLRTALNLILDELDLTYVEVEGEKLLLVTTQEDAESTMQVRVYDCRDLLSMEAPEGASKYVPAAALRSRSLGGLGGGGFGGGGLGGGGGFFAVDDEVPSADDDEDALASPAGGAAAGSPAGAAAANSGVAAGAMPGGGGMGGMGGGGFSIGGLGEVPNRPWTEHDLRAERLIEILQRNIDPNSWTDMGGSGSIGEYNGLVVITQSARTHKKIERLLDMLREAAGLEIPEDGGVVR